MGDLVRQQFQASPRIRIELSPPEEDVGARREGDRIHALGELVGLRVVVDPDATEVMVQSLFQVTSHRSREGIPTPTPGLETLQHRLRRLGLQFRQLALNGQGFESLLVLGGLCLLPLQGQVDGPLQGGTFPLWNQAQDDPGHWGTAGMTLQSDQVCRIVVVTFLRRSPIGAEALDQRLSDLPLEGTELCDLAGTGHAAFDLLRLGPHHGDPVRWRLRLSGDGLRLGLLAEEGLLGGTCSQLDAVGLPFQGLALA
ncbi:hypothetical protein ASF71_17260 [Deinococcus sp. Leaf326]|nr:hypothetical protein ASF71_17260 [Deinococcus sp. Leaf326]